MHNISDNQFEKEQADLSRFELIKLGSPREALGVITFLASFDRDFVGKQFNRTVSKLYASIAHGKVLVWSLPVEIKGNKVDHPALVVTWINPNPITAAVVINGIRDCFAGEANEGGETIVTSVISPFYDKETVLHGLALPQLEKITGSSNPSFLL